MIILQFPAASSESHVRRKRGLFPVFPERFNERYNKDDRRQRPCQRISPGDNIVHRDEMQRHRYVNDTDDAPAGQHGEHRDDGFLITAQHTGSHMGEA